MSTITLAPTRVLIVDDQPVVRNGVAFALMALDDVQLVGAAASGEEALKLADTLRPDVVVMDLKLPGMDGITATQRLRARHSDLQVLVLTGYLEPELIRAALEAGATGYLSKDVSFDEIGRAIRLTRAGHSILSDGAAQALIQNASKQPMSIMALTEREREVLALVAAGLSNHAIARQLIISTATARWHVTMILKKLGAANRAEAAAICQGYNLLRGDGHDGQAMGHQPFAY